MPRTSSIEMEKSLKETCRLIHFYRKKYERQGVKFEPREYEINALALSKQKRNIKARKESQ